MNTNLEFGIAVEWSATQWAGLVIALLLASAFYVLVQRLKQASYERAVAEKFSAGPGPMLTAEQAERLHASHYNNEEV